MGLERTQVKPIKIFLYSLKEVYTEIQLLVSSVNNRAHRLQSALGYISSSLLFESQNQFPYEILKIKYRFQENFWTSFIPCHNRYTPGFAGKRASFFPLCRSGQRKWCCCSQGMGDCMTQPCPTLRYNKTQCGAALILIQNKYFHRLQNSSNTLIWKNT